MRINAAGTGIVAAMISGVGLAVANKVGTGIAVDSTTDEGVIIVAATTTITPLDFTQFSALGYPAFDSW